MKRKDVEIPEPCSADWSEMTGDEQRRFCDHCAKHVHDLSAMTEPEAKSLLQKESNLCVRYKVDANEQIRFRKPSRRRFVARAGAMALGLSVGLPAAADMATSGGEACSENPLTQLARSIYETFFGPAEPEMVFAGAVAPIEIVKMGEVALDPDTVEPEPMPIREPVQMGRVAFEPEPEPKPDVEHYEEIMGGPVLRIEEDEEDAE